MRRQGDAHDVMAHGLLSLHVARTGHRCWVAGTPAAGQHSAPLPTPGTRAGAPNGRQCRTTRTSANAPHRRLPSIHLNKLFQPFNRFNSNSEESMHACCKAATPPPLPLRNEFFSTHPVHGFKCTHVRMCIGVGVLVCV